MPNPKRRHSKSRRRKRRTGDSIKSPGLTTCSNCGEPVQPHRACPKCGFYKGRRVIEMPEE